MRFIVLGENKANMCTNSAAMEELVCLSSKVEHPRGLQSAQGERETVITQSGRNGLAIVPLCH